MIKENEIYLMDCIEGMKDIPDGSVDLLLTDPPYNVSSDLKIVDTRGKNGNRIIDYNFGEWDKFTDKDYYEFMLSFLDISTQTMKDGANFVSWIAKEYLPIYIDYWKIKKWKIKDVLVWVKTNPVPQLRKVKFQQATEFCFWGVKGDINGTFNYQLGQHPNCFRRPILGGHERTAHPTQKPMDITKTIISYLSNENDLVLDPFLGSGTTAVACKQLGRRYIGFENNQEYFDIAKKRLSQDVLI